MVVNIVFQVENIRRILFIEGENDQGCKSVESAKHAISQLQALGLNNYELLQYPGAGHLIDMPYIPVVTMTRWGFTSGTVKELKGEFIHESTIYITVIFIVLGERVDGP